MNQNDWATQEQKKCEDRLSEYEDRAKNLCTTIADLHRQLEWVIEEANRARASLSALQKKPPKSWVITLPYKPTECAREFNTAMTKAEKNLGRLGNETRATERTMTT